mgnify:CR=1 FL=1
MDYKNRRNLDGSDVTFPQDDEIRFDEATHTYTVDGLGELTPVSTVIQKFFKPFDAEYWSLRKSGGDERAAARLRETWRGGQRASQRGTFLPSCIGASLNGKGPPTRLQCETSFNGQYVDMHESVDISREWQYFKEFDAHTEYTPFRTEWRIFDREARMAGTIDLLCAYTNGTYELYDWKRSKKVDPQEQNRWNSGINGLEHLPDTSFFHYALQQNLYRYMLEKNYSLSISRMHLVVLHPEEPAYRIVPVPKMEREVQHIINFLTRSND